MSTQTPSQTRATPTWPLWLLAIALLVVFIWVRSIAGSARSTAEANYLMLEQPQVNIQYLVGGPQRFADDFTEAVDDAEVAGFSSDDYLWATALVSNDGSSDLRDVDLTVSLSDGLEPLIVASLPSFGADVDMEQTDAGLVVDLRDIDEDEVARVFLGFNPASLPSDVADAWGRSYQTTIGSLTIDGGDDLAETYYGRAI